MDLEASRSHKPPNTIIPTSALHRGGPPCGSATRDLRDSKPAAEDPIRVFGAQRVAVDDEVPDARCTWPAQAQRAGTIDSEAILDTVEPRDGAPAHADQRQHRVPADTVRTAAWIVAEGCVFPRVGEIEWLAIIGRRNVINVGRAPPAQRRVGVDRLDPTNAVGEIRGSGGIPAGHSGVNAAPVWP